MRSARYCTRCTIRGASVHFAPLGAAGSAIFQSSLLTTSMRKASDFPSGAHSRSEGVSVTRVICDVAPSPSIHRTKTCVPVPGTAPSPAAGRAPAGSAARAR